MGALLAVTLLSAGVAPSFLDRGEWGHGPVMESEHDSAQCHAHDHNICILLGGSPAAPTAGALALKSGPTRHRTAVVAAIRSTEAHRATSPPARAPPLL